MNLLDLIDSYGIDLDTTPESFVKMIETDEDLYCDILHEYEDENEDDKK